MAMSLTPVAAAAMVAIAGATPALYAQVARDCPRTLVVDGDTVGALSVPGPLTNVPEFHDCQRLVMGQSYGPLVGIWVSHRLVDLPDSQARVVEPESVLCPRFWSAIILRRSECSDLRRSEQPRLSHAMLARHSVAYAQIYSWDGAYLPLGIRRGFNCLFLRRQPNGEWSAWMVSVATDFGCAQVLPVLTPREVSQAQAAITALRVRQLPRDVRLDAADIPDVARWEWSPRGRQQYIGIKCGNQWCQVGNHGSSYGRRLAEDRAPGTVSSFTVAQRRARRVAHIPGWFDQQYLAPVPASGSHSGIWGTIIPDSMLDDYRDADFATGLWLHTARVNMATASPRSAAPAISYYRQKLNLGVGNNEIFLCRDTNPTERPCVPPDSLPPGPAYTEPETNYRWWARIVAPDSTAYRRVTRCDFGGRHVVGTARWRWLAEDETLWMRCVDGCCQVEP